MRATVRCRGTPSASTLFTDLKEEVHDGSDALRDGSDAERSAGLREVIVRCWIAAFEAWYVKTEIGGGTEESHNERHAAHIYCHLTSNSPS